MTANVDSPMPNEDEARSFALCEDPNVLPLDKSINLDICVK